MREIIINSNEAGQRLDKYLFKYFKEASNGFIYKMLRKKNIVLNGKKSTGKEILSLEDSVKIFMKDETIEKFRGNDNFVKVDYSDLNIIYEDDDVIMLNKPSGVLSQKASDDDISINEEVISYLLDQNKISDEELKTFRPSICNRLDRNTSGLIVAGKTLIALQELSKLFKERLVDKYYIAVVEGIVKENLSLDGYLQKDEKTNTVKIVDQPLDGFAPIKTNVEVLEKHDDYSVLKIKLITGKTHQIRAHLSSIGHPILGDFKYKASSNIAKKYNVHRTLLHSYYLIFNDTVLNSVKNKQFIADVPDDISALMEG